MADLSHVFTNKTFYEYVYLQKLQNTYTAYDTYIKVTDQCSHAKEVIMRLSYHNNLFGHA